MEFEYSDKVKGLITQLEAFMEEHIYPREQDFIDHLETTDNRWGTHPIVEELKPKAKAAGLWNLFLPDPEHGAGLNNLEYAPLAEIMGRCLWSSEVFNCSAPDTGNMEVFSQYASAAQKEKWLKPLLNGDIRSAFAMTEPEVASSDATNIETSIVRDGDEYVVNGRKWYISGAMNDHCKIMIVMGKTDPTNPNRHIQQSQILVPMDTKGVKIVRPMQVMGWDDAPEGHAEIIFDNVRVPAENIILGEGRGFEIAQGRLGPGRIHHCMRLIGQAQRALEAMCKRADSRVAFGKKLADQGSVREDIARSACEIDQARLLTLKAANTMDLHGNKVAQGLISQIKIIAPMMAITVLERAMQMHGAMGLSQDTFLARSYSYARTIRLADGPDQVHMSQLGKRLIQRYTAE
jgi:acyl-CoA dehydrogenase